VIHDRCVTGPTESLGHLGAGVFEGPIDLVPELGHGGDGGLVPERMPQQAEAPDVLDVGAAGVAESVRHMPNTSKGFFGIRAP
jgi:hypothetical protein